ncbi:MAG: Fur family transcriptional regulator [Patescibacteria group bacterium]
MAKKDTHPEIDLAGILRANGYRATSGRLAILGVLVKEKKPLSSHEIFERCKTGSLDAVTVYRALEAFVASRIVKRIDLQHGHVDYEFAFGDHHHHLVCKKCGSVEDFTVTGCTELAQRACKSSTTFKTVEDHSMELFGVCVSCS